MDNINEGLLYQGKLPVSFLHIKNFPSDNRLAIINEENESFLKTSLILHENVEVDEHDEIKLELRRQDLKIKLLIEMVGELLSQRKSMPEPMPIKLTADAIEFAASEDFKTGDKLEIDIYITPSTPKTLTFFGEAAVNEGNKTVIIHFIGVSQQVQDWLEKIIFRHHRRTIAHSHELDPDQDSL